MIIVLFHVLYLFGKYIYRSYRVNKLGSQGDAASEAESTERQSYETFDEASCDAEDSPKPLYPEIDLKFKPSACRQRYNAVLDELYLYAGTLRKVVDFGCAALSFSEALRCDSETLGIRELFSVDIDEEVLRLNKYRAEPNVAYDHGYKKSPFLYQIYEGSVTHNDRKLENTDAVICIELIEHLYPDTLLDLPFNIFGYIMPRVAIFTTPNAEFNVLFPNFSGYRHPDHKFEWTREQFQDWAQNIVTRYPSYSVEFRGICYGPKGTEELGALTQMAIFRRLSPIEECNRTPGVDGLFKTVAIYDFPLYVDDRTEEEKIRSEATYHIIHISYENGYNYREAVYLSEVLPHILEKYDKYPLTIEKLRTILEENWTIEDREDGPTAIISPIPWHKRDDWPWCWEREKEAKEYEDEQESQLLTNEISANVHEGYSHMQDSYTENCEESSIIIPENRSVIQENTYLFDGENSLLEEYQIEEKPDIIYDDSTTETLVTEREIPSNSISLVSNETDDRVQIIDPNMPVFATSSAVFNSNSNLQPSPSQSVEINSRTIQQDPLTLNLQPHMSSKPYFSSFDLNFSKDYSANYQNEFYNNQFLLNNTFHQSEMADEAAMNVEESIVEAAFGLEDSLSGDHAQESEKNFYLSPDYVCNYPNYPELLNNGCNVQDISVRNQVCQNNDIVDTVPLNAYSNSFSNQPKFASSPKAKLNVTPVIDQSCSKRKGLISAMDTDIRVLSSIKEAIKETVTDIDSKLEDTSQKSNNINTTTERITFCVTSSNSDIKSTSSYISCASSNNTQQESCLEDESNRQEENASCTLATALTRADDTETHLGNTVISDSAQSNTKSLNSLRESLSSKSQSGQHSSPERAKEISVLENDRSVSRSTNEDMNNVQFTSVLRSEENASTSKDASNISVNNVEAKPPSPLETPPNSWSPEIMDSGYPNSASAQDITPEYDLSSIAQDQIPDSESPSVAEAPRLLGVLEPIEVENGDLANNNRDDEGNNMMAVDADDIENLQPLIDVLENDLENENDIYVMQNGFPMWLLRILDMANPLDMQNLRIADEVADGADHDEGFDSSSSENESEVAYNEVENDSGRGE